jgi:hypothetical protein
VAAQTGPARFLATTLGTDAETVIRWLVALLVMLIDPSAVVLTIAASRGRRSTGRSVCYAAGPVAIALGEVTTLSINQSARIFL